MSRPRPRGHSTSAIHVPSHYSSASIVGPLSRVTSAPNVPHLDHFEHPKREYDGILRSSFRSRSRSPRQPSVFGISECPSEEEAGFSTPMCRSPSTWRDDRKNIGETNRFVQQPWREPPGRCLPPDEHKDDWEHTRERVAQASVSVLGITADVVYRALTIGARVLEHAPVPGLSSVAKILLEIWDAVQLVDTNRLACLRLTERCADILLSIRQEVKEAGDMVHDQLFMPISKLVESFNKIHTFLQKQIHRPFLKRFLKREEILSQIQVFHEDLNNSVGMFNISVQVRILHQVQKSECQRTHDTEIIMKTLSDVLGMRGRSINGLPSSPSHGSLNAQDVGSNGSSAPTQIAYQQYPAPLDVTYTSVLPSTTFVPSAQVLPALCSLHLTQNSLDAQRDMADLRALMRSSLETRSDVEMMKVLQIGREEMPEAIGTLERALEKLRTQEKEIPGEARNEGERGSPAMSLRGDGLGKDPVDREFVESGIDVLRRMSRGVIPKLPSWTITRYEIDRDEKIGLGFFSDVYKGTWRGRTVAIKVLAESTPRQLFIREVEIWKELKHENVLELYGASCAQGDPPWFFVSPYERNGSLVEFLKRTWLGNTERGVGLGLVALPIWEDGLDMDRKLSRMQAMKKEDVFRFMLEIAKGMEYLHRNGVLHGDLKAANVLVDDECRCVISDFGQSEMRSEAYRISGTPPPRGTLRWQSPELMSGLNHLSLTPHMDVYAYAICCVEILTMGKMPWPLTDDETVRYLVLRKNSRPPIPNTCFNTPLLQDLLRVCWDNDPAVRPPFRKIVREAEIIREDFGGEHIQGRQGHMPSVRKDEPHSSMHATMWDWESHSPKTLPIIRPVPLSVSPSGGRFFDTSLGTTKEDVSYSPSDPAHRLGKRSHRRENSSSSAMRMPEPVFYSPSVPSSHTSFSPTLLPSPYSREQLDHPTPDTVEPAIQGRSPPPRSPPSKEKKNRRKNSQSLTFPLWNSMPVALGAVGYLSKSTGTFVTLFNAFRPDESGINAVKGLPSLHEYIASCHRDKKTAVQSVWGAFMGMLASNVKGEELLSPKTHRRASSSARASPKAMVTTYHYVESVEAAKKWLKSNAESVLQIYGPSHHIKRDDLFLVTGTLDKPEQALFINHPTGQAHLNVLTSPMLGQSCQSPPPATVTTPDLSRGELALGSPPSIDGDLDQRRFSVPYSHC